MYFLKKHGLKFVLAFYAFLHIAQLEVFPFYHFAMYSQRIYPKENFYVYEIRLQDQIVDLSKMNYRKYVYLTNTIKAFEAMNNNNGCHPSSEIINKYYSQLRLQALADRMQKESYCLDNLNTKTTNWLLRFFNSPGEVSIFKNYYNWPGKGTIIRTRQKRIL